MMSEMTGMDLHALLSESSPADAARNILLTGGVFTRAAQEFLDRVPNTRIAKPFDPQDLRTTVRSWAVADA